MSSSFKDVQDEYGIGNGTYNYAQQKQAKTKQKNIVREATAPAHVLDAAGIEVPGQSFNPENAREYPTTKECV